MRYNLVSSDLNDLEKYIDNYTWKESLETLEWLNSFCRSKGDNSLYYTTSTTEGLKALVTNNGWDLYEFIDRYFLGGFDNETWILRWDGKTLSGYSSISSFILEVRNMLLRYYNGLTEEDILYHKMSDNLPKILQDADELIKGRITL